MADSFVSFSNHHSMDFFPTFQSFPETRNEKDAFTVDKRDIEEIQNKVSTNPIQKTKKSKHKRSKLNDTKIAGSTPIVQCDICSVPISGPIAYDSHFKGKKHQAQLAAVLVKNPEYKVSTYEELCLKKQESVVMNNEAEKLEGSRSESTVNEKPTVPASTSPRKLNCNMCNISCNSQQMFDNHIAGRKHQMKLKSNNLNNLAPPRAAPDNNPSSSNYCDVCSLQLNSEHELTEHLAQKQHQTKFKEAEYCAREGADMSINFDDYRISTTDTEKNNFTYQCAPCKKKFRNKIQVIEHLKSALHNRLANQPKSQNPSTEPKRNNFPGTRAGFTRSDSAARSQKFSFRGSNKSSGKTRPYRSRGFARNQSIQAFGRGFDQQTFHNPFGAFDPNNQSALSSNNNCYGSMKRATQYEETLNEYDGFYPKRSRAYDGRTDGVQDFYSSNNTCYTSSTVSSYPWNSSNYSSQIDTYNYQSSALQPPWQYQTESHYEQQPYSGSGSTCTNPMYYSSNPPPLPSYEPPPLPNYPPPLSQMRGSQNSAFFRSSENQGNNTFFFQNSFGQ